MKTAESTRVKMQEKYTVAIEKMNMVSSDNYLDQEKLEAATKDVAKALKDVLDEYQKWAKQNDIPDSRLDQWKVAHLQPGVIRFWDTMNEWVYNKKRFEVISQYHGVQRILTANGKVLVSRGEGRPDKILTSVGSNYLLNEEGQKEGEEHNLRQQFSLYPTVLTSFINTFDAI